MRNEMATYERLKVVLTANRDALLNRQDVNSIAIGYKHVGGQKTDQLAMIISVSRKIPERELDEEDVLPKLIQGCPTDVVEREVVDPFRNFNKN